MRLLVRWGAGGWRGGIGRGQRRAAHGVRSCCWGIRSQAVRTQDFTLATPQRTQCKQAPDPALLPAPPARRKRDRTASAGSGNVGAGEWGSRIRQPGRTSCPGQHAQQRRALVACALESPTPGVSCGVVPSPSRVKPPPASQAVASTSTPIWPSSADTPGARCGGVRWVAPPGGRHHAARSGARHARDGQNTVRN
jgi:hypothetical protein